MKTPHEERKREEAKEAQSGQPGQKQTPEMIAKLRAMGIHVDPNAVIPTKENWDPVGLPKHEPAFIRDDVETIDFALTFSDRQGVSPAEADEVCRMYDAAHALFSRRKRQSAMSLATEDQAQIAGDSVKLGAPSEPLASIDEANEEQEDDNASDNASVASASTFGSDGGY